MTANTALATPDAMIRHYQPMVRRMAHHMLSKLPASVEADDLIQVGLIGLSEALNRYQAAEGVQFETFASQRIRGAMIDQLRENDWLPRSSRRMQKDISQAEHRLEHSLGRAPRDSEVAAEMNLSLTGFHALCTRADGPRMVYLEDLSSGADDDSYLDRFTADEDHDPLRQLGDEEMHAALGEAIRQLPEREQYVMTMYYERDMNLKAIAKELGVTESRVCQLRNQAVERLRVKLRQHH